MASDLSDWETVFNKLFGSLPDEWSVSEATDGLPNISEARDDGWKQFQDKGKVHFECYDCRKSWSSLKGAVIFHYRRTPLRNTRRGKKGEVKFECLGQMCDRCRTDEFEEPIWYQKEIERAVENLLLKVKEKFYKGPKKAVDERQLGGNMTAGHQKELCQACQRGVCGLRDDESESPAVASLSEELSHLGFA